MNVGGWIVLVTNVKAGVGGIIQDPWPASEAKLGDVQMFYLGVASFITSLWITLGGEGGCPSGGGQCYVLRLSMIKSGSCCFPQHLDGAQHCNNAKNRRVPLIWLWEETRLAVQNLIFLEIIARLQLLTTGFINPVREPRLQRSKLTKTKTLVSVGTKCLITSKKLHLKCGYSVFYYNKGWCSFCL